MKFKFTWSDATFSLTNEFNLRICSAIYDSFTASSALFGTQSIQSYYINSGSTAAFVFDNLITPGYASCYKAIVSVYAIDMSYNPLIEFY